MKGAVLVAFSAAVGSLLQGWDNATIAGRTFELEDCDRGIVVDGIGEDETVTVGDVELEVGVVVGRTAGAEVDKGKGVGDGDVLDCVA
ncbi:hypothetical protein Leryth_025845 [Lithospermum erythrorhizon]|nr:hypothetical protein Leryth_025845 [Lithospermum erythrorhizon]